MLAGGASDTCGAPRRVSFSELIGGDSLIKRRNSLIPDGAIVLLH